MKDMIPFKKDALTPAQFQKLADVPPEVEWLANITNEKTRRAYKIDVSEFSRYLRLNKPEEMRTVTRAHVIAWRKYLEARVMANRCVTRRVPVGLKPGRKPVQVRPYRRSRPSRRCSSR